jgi:hypothetical protein
MQVGYKAQATVVETVDKIPGIVVAPFVDHGPSNDAKVPAALVVDLDDDAVLSEVLSK